MFAPDFKSLLAVAVATLDRNGKLLEGNAGFLRLMHQSNLSAHHEQVDCLFIQPTFASLLKALPDADGMIYQGLLTLGEYAGKTRSLSGKIWLRDDTLQVQAEYDIGGIEQLNDTVLKLNQDYTKAQFEITQINLKLKQRELELEQSLAKLEASNLRLITTQKQLVEAEKMAALGVMVAGVAHEINTPLGISLGSASLLEQQSHALSLSFAEKRMTQSELQNYLANTLAETELIRANLERLGRLTEQFHQLAVNDKSATRSRFLFKQCLEDVITSMGIGTFGKAFVVTISCDPALVVESFASDWASIFTNLISNSVHHGFKDENRGAISITVATREGMLLVDYADDGMGLSEYTQAHIFDPFFTTDMQQGMGLGMHLIYNLITQKLHGHIRCSSSSHQGAHFHIEIPL